MDRQKHLRMPGGFEPPHDLLSAPSMAMWRFASIVQALMAAMINVWAKFSNGNAIIAEFIRYKDAWTAPTLHQFAHKTGCRFTISSALHEDF